MTIDVTWQLFHLEERLRILRQENRELTHHADKMSELIHSLAQLISRETDARQRSIADAGRLQQAILAHPYYAAVARLGGEDEALATFVNHTAEHARHADKP